MTSIAPLPTARACRTNGVDEIQIKTGPYCGVATQIGANNNTLNATLAMLSRATLAFPFNRVIDGYFHNTPPSMAVRAKKIANVPLMMGRTHI